MKKLMTLAAAILALSSIANADQVATITCKGAKVILEVKSPYLGENSPAAQKLYVLKSKDTNDKETRNTAFFLDIEEDIGGRNSCFGAGSLIFDGTNKAGGSFNLCIQVWQDKSDGTVVRYVSEGFITYNHGPLAGKDEKVSCVLE